ELCSCFWYYKILTTLMPMPETSMYKYYSLILLEYKVRFSGEFFIMQPISVSMAMKKFSYNYFWFRILPTNTTHIVTPRFWIMNIRHNNANLQFTKGLAEN